MPDGILLSKKGLVFLVVVRRPTLDLAYITEDIADLDSYHGSLRMVSPLIGIEPMGKIPKLTKSGTIHFFFTPSPEAKLRLVTQLQELSGLAVFFSHGNAEVVCLHNGQRLTEQIKEICSRVGVVEERWVLNSHRIETHPTAEENHHTLPSPSFTDLDAVAPDGSGYIRRELRCLMLRRHDGSSLCIRSTGPPAQTYINQLLTSLEGAVDEHAKLSEMWKFAGAHTYNVDQRFSGLSPILALNCPMGGFEVLGIGKALRAIEGLGGFVFRCFHESRLWERLAILACGQENGPLELKFTGALGLTASKYYADAIPLLRTAGKLDVPRDRLALPGQPDSVLAEDTREDMMSLVTYFSAREGFQFDGVGISIPLQVISSGNTLQWSLMSLTHEYCHVISAAVLSIVKSYWHSTPNMLPDLCYAVRNEQKEIAGEEPRLIGASPLEFVSKALLHGRVHEKPIDEVTLGEIATSRFKREDEVMTLVFDLFYFFRGVAIWKDDIQGRHAAGGVAVSKRALLVCDEIGGDRR
jgi:hypothetical protein